MNFDQQEIDHFKDKVQLYYKSSLLLISCGLLFEKQNKVVSFFFWTKSYTVRLSRLVMVGPFLELLYCKLK